MAKALLRMHPERRRQQQNFTQFSLLAWRTPHYGDTMRVAMCLTREPYMYVLRKAWQGCTR